MILNDSIENCREISISESIDISSVLIIIFVDCGHCDVINELYQYFGAVFKNFQSFRLRHEILNN
jgi:hypothetical protein